MNAILNTDLSGELGNGTNDIYPNGQNIHVSNYYFVDFLVLDLMQAFKTKMNACLI